VATGGRPPGDGPYTGTERAAKVARAQQILGLRLQGYTLVQIGAALTPPIGRTRVQQILEKLLRETVPEAVEQLREIEGLRIAELMTVFYPRAVDGDLQAGVFVLKLMERYARLFALDLAQPGTIVDLNREDGYPIDPQTGERILRIEVIGDPEATRRVKLSDPSRPYFDQSQTYNVSTPTHGYTVEAEPDA
jgi:hypothetical protein